MTRKIQRAAARACAAIKKHSGAIVAGASMALAGAANAQSTNAVQGLAEISSLQTTAIVIMISGVVIWTGARLVKKAVR